MVSLANAARHEASLEMAKFLLQIRAVKLNNKEPFTWASGRKSPIYCDNRVTLSYPHVRNFIRQEFVNLIEEHIGPVDAVAGVATGGIPQGALVAQELGLPFVYVRSEAKNHGKTWFRPGRAAFWRWMPCGRMAAWSKAWWRCSPMGWTWLPRISSRPRCRCTL